MVIFYVCCNILTTKGNTSCFHHCHHHFFQLNLFIPKYLFSMVCFYWWPHSYFQGQNLFLNLSSYVLQGCNNRSKAQLIGCLCFFFFSSELVHPINFLKNWFMAFYSWMCMVNLNVFRHLLCVLQHCSGGNTSQILGYLELQVKPLGILCCK